MSAPQTDPEKQFWQHPVPLIGMAVVCIAVLLGFLWWLFYEVDTPDASPEVQRQQEVTPAANPPPPQQ